MRYIQLQRILQSKMSELEKLCLRERQLLEGKWKTHSLPARKKASQAAEVPGTPTQSTTYCRPTVSTEDVGKMQQKNNHQPPATVMLAYQYLDHRYQYVLQPSTTGSGEYLLTFEPSQYQGEEHHFIVKTPCDPPLKQNKANQTNGGKNKKNVGHGGQLCNPCVQGNNNGDNTSLEAYDLASPCCDPHCVPNARRRSRNHRKTGETQTQTEPVQRPRPHSQASQTHISQSVPRRYLQFGVGLVSQCSLHSCTSSELSAVAPTTTGESTASYTTSLSTDTLYWDGSNEANSSRPQSIKSKYEYHHRSGPPEPIYIHYNATKPKSWDNLATKAIGGYGFGYGYLDTTKCAPGKQHKSPQYFRVCRETHTGPSTSNYSQRRYIQPTKSTESLLSGPKYSNEALSDSSLSCECLEAEDNRFFRSPTDSNYYRRPSRGVATSSEATRL